MRDIAKLDDATMYAIGFDRPTVGAFRHILEAVGPAVGAQTLPQTVAEVKDINNAGPGEPIAASASPLSFTATRRGVLLIAGDATGIVTLVEFVRGGFSYPAGMISGPLYMMKDDVVRITYAAAPSLIFLPG